MLSSNKVRLIIALAFLLLGPQLGLGATRFYLRSIASATPISPTPAGGWNDSSILIRANTTTALSGTAMTTMSFSDADETAKGILFMQFISPQLTAGQTITGAQVLKMQILASEPDAGNDIFVDMLIRVIAKDGTTVQKTVYTGTKDDVEVVLTTLTNRQYSVTSAATNYTTILGDYLVIEVGIFADPQVGKTHGSSLRFGDSAGADLAEDDTTTTDNNPWFQLTDTLTFTCQRQLTLMGAGC
jgi:hypothetical protein